jgi:hypothetical protein
VVKICQSEAPQVRDIWIRVGLVMRTPTKELITHGTTPPRKMMKTLPHKPMPNQKMVKGIHAMGGIGEPIQTTRHPRTTLNQPGAATRCRNQ